MQAAAAPQTAEQVRAHLAQAVADAPDDPLALLELALFDRQTNNLALAEQELLECWKKFPRFARAPFHLGMLYMEQGRHALAVPPLRAAAKLDATDAITQVNAGFACQSLGMEREARQYAHAAIKIDPWLPQPYLLLARLDDTHGTAQRALAHLDTYLERSPDPASGYFLKGRIYARLADGSNAEIWLKRAIEAAPDNADFWTTLGRVHTELFNNARTEEGIHSFQKALELSPNHADAHRYYGLALKRLRRFEEAVPHLQAALNGAEDPGPLYYDLGQTLMQAGRAEEGKAALTKHQSYRAYTEGITRLSRALEQSPQDRSRHHALIRFCLQHKQFASASRALDEAMRRVGPDETLRGLAAELETEIRTTDLTAARPKAP